MFIKNPSRQFVVFITILFPFVFTGAIFAGAPNNDLNADLIKASFSGDMLEVELLLAKGADVNAKRVDGITALMGASLEGHKEVVRLLLVKGADVNVKAKNFGRNGNGATANFGGWGTSTVNIKGSTFSNADFKSSCGQHSSGAVGGEAW